MLDKRTVYILGAGFNQCINNIYGMKPPLSTDFFSFILNNEKYNNSGFYVNTSCVYAYIYKYWKKSKNDLSKEPFNLEDCFSLLQLQMLGAKAKGDSISFSKLKNINSTLKMMFIESLQDFSYSNSNSNLILQFAKLILSSKSNILTLNYDCNLENAMYSLNNSFSFSSCYGICFSNYKTSPLYDWSILKLHGSLNWFKYNDKLLLINNKNSFNDCILEPLIIPPVIYKDYTAEFIFNLWEKAGKILSTCNTLVIIGYSFPSTDFGIKKLLLECLVNEILEQIIIVNPDTSIVGTIKNLLNFKNPVIVCNDLNEFLSNLDSIALNKQKVQR